MYTITFKPSAEKDLNKLPKAMVKKTVTAIDGLRENPRPVGVKKLKASNEHLYRIRVGDYRVLYTIDDTIQIIDISRIGHRKDIYK